MQKENRIGECSNMSEAELLQVVCPLLGTKQEDRELPEASLRRRALEEILQRNQEWLLRMCLFELRDEDVAYDCLQEILIEIATSIQGFRAKSELKTWMYAIAKRVVFRTRRQIVKRRVAKIKALDENLSDRNSSLEQQGDTKLLSAERQGLILDAVASLPPRQREAVMLYYYEDLSVKQAAERVGCSSGTLKTHLHRARNRLAKIFPQDLGDLR